MAARSPSPNPTKASKTPESANLLRKSGSSIFSKPSKPQDVLRRSSGSKSVTAAPLMRSSFEHKENERAARARSPAPPSKGAKNFMAPTISAASKAVAAYPRKVLAERNEGGEAEEFGVKPEMGFCSQEVLVKREPRRIDSGIKNGQSAGILLFSPSDIASGDQGGEAEEFGVKPEMGFGSQEVLVKREPRRIDSEINNGQSAGILLFSPPVMAPLDADPSLPPYDPKTNYLSPRPQFLHYKPNPRIEYYHREEESDSFEVGDGKRLEDSFSSESYEDTLGDTDEARSVSSTSSELEAEEAEGVKDETQVSESELNPEGPEPNRKNPKPRSFLRSKLAPLLLVMLITCLSIPLADSPMVSSSSPFMLKDQSFPKLLRVFEEHRLGNYLNEVAVLARPKLGRIANRFQHWLANYIPHYTTVPEVVLFHLANFTAPDVDLSLQFRYGVRKHSEEESSLESEMEKIIEDNLDRDKEDSCSGSEPQWDAEIDSMVGMRPVDVFEGSEEYQAEAEAEADAEEMAMRLKDAFGVEGVQNGVKSSEAEVSVVVEEISSLLLDQMENEEGGEEMAMRLKDAFGVEGVENEVKSSEAEISVVVEEISSLLLDQMENEEGGVIEEKQEVVQNFEEVVGEEGVIEERQEDVLSFREVVTEEKENVGNIHLESDWDDQSSCELRPVKSVNYALKDKFSTRAALGISSIAVALAAMVFLCMKLMQSPAVVHENLTAKKVRSVSGSSERPFCPSDFSMDVEMIGDSGPSEISSSLHTTLSNGRPRTKKAKEETFSNEKKSRRDSTASTSVSYGSFTTYERLSAKKGGRDESEVTPVRRSSRIRQLTTP